MHSLAVSNISEEDGEPQSGPEASGPEHRPADKMPFAFELGRKKQTETRGCCVPRSQLPMACSRKHLTFPISVLPSLLVPVLSIASWMRVRLERARVDPVLHRPHEK